MAIPSGNRSRANKKSERMAKSLGGYGSMVVRKDAALEPLFADRLQHRLGRDLVRVVADVEQILAQINVDATDPRKP